MDRRKILVAALFVAVTVGLGYLLYFMFFRPTPTEVEIPAGNVNVGAGALPRAITSPPRPIETLVSPAAVLAPSITPPPQLPAEVSSVAHGGSTWIGTLVNKSVSAARLSSNGSDIAYYDKTDNKFYRVDENGNATALSDKTFPNAENISFAPDTNKAIVEFPDGANVFFDFTTQKQVTLPKHWKDFTFSPDSTQIAGKSMGVDPDNRWLFISNPDGSGVQAIEPLGDNESKVDVTWSPNNQVIATSRTGQAMGFDRQQILLIGKNHENFPGLTVEGLGFKSQWSKNGDHLLYSVYNSSSDYKPTLWLVGAQGDNIGAGRKSLAINTWADKCTFSDDATVYCAVPQTMDRGAGFQPDLFGSVPDSFYKIDLSTGLKSLVATPYGSFSAKNPMVSADGKYLTYTNQQTGVLERIQLK
jgi:Tol biopolymer transport system component